MSLIIRVISVSRLIGIRVLVSLYRLRINYNASYMDNNEINFFAKTNFRNQERIFGIKTDDRRRHIYVVGKTGMGKTNLLENMVVQDIRNGKGICYIDPHGDTAEKLIKAIGVSNYTIKHLKELLSYCNIVPAVNQVEFNPYLYQQDLLEFCESKNIKLVAYSPIARGEKLKDEKLVMLSSKYDKTPAQMMLRWAIQHGILVIPKSAHKERIEENANIFDFEIADDDMESIDSFNENFRTCWDPSNVK